MNVFRMEEEHEEKQYMDDAGSRLIILLLCLGSAPYKCAGPYIYSRTISSQCVCGVFQDEYYRKILFRTLEIDSYYHRDLHGRRDSHRIFYKPVVIKMERSSSGSIHFSNDDKFCDPKFCLDQYFRKQRYNQPHSAGSQCS